MPLNLDALKDKQARRATKGWTPKEGDNLIRVLPHTLRYFSENTPDFAHEFRSHFMKAEGTDLQVFRCIRDNRQPCPICQALVPLKASPDPKKKKIYDDCRAGERHLMNIINLNDIAVGIQVYETGPKVYDDLLGFMANPAWGDLISPAQGRNITLNMTPGSKSRSGYQEYKVQPHPTPTDVTPHLPVAWKEKLEDLEKQLPSYPSPEDVARWLKLLGLEGQTDAPPPPPSSASQPETPPSPPASAAVPPKPVAPVPASTPVVAAEIVQNAPTSVPPTTSANPSAVFAQANGMGVRQETAVKATEGLVPQCFSTGPGTGFNPAQFPCDKGCPVRADCQLRNLGLA